MRFLQNKDKVRGSSVETKNSLILKLAYLFVNNKYDNNFPLVIHKPMCVELVMQELRRDGHQRKRYTREGERESHACKRKGEKVMRVRGKD
jgi:hypothetical protein